MSVSKARDNLKQARREIADSIDQLPQPLLFRGRATRSKRNRMKRSITAIDNAIEALRGL